MKCSFCSAEIGIAEYVDGYQKMYCKRCYDLRIGSYKQLNRVFHYWYCKYCDAPYYNKPDADLHEKTCEQMPKKAKRRMEKKQ